ncbi:Fructosamine kinase-domain-containing protein [Lophiotrema nucula]|uniref:protein-ribulosamine 3-kinase n=1 Tax=Lophiotrema nucula TaxID=690887 RepID=A0A6A5ZSX9_9PLEO|nr:Fructosamine kinase-domain-containing protein [Lophiotrema nucula]
MGQRLSDGLLAIPIQACVKLTILTALPQGTIITAASFHGEANVWFATGRINTKSADGKCVEYFVKYAAGSLAQHLIGSEYHCAEKMHSVALKSTPRPISWGDLDVGPIVQGYFLVLEFVPFSDEELPDPGKVAALVADLHIASHRKELKFGSPIPTFDGILCHVDGWEDTWPKLFSKILSRAYHYDELTNGTSLELQKAYRLTQGFIIPRLLSQLTRNGKGLEPCFIHGDLWEGNFGTHRVSGQLYSFDSNGYYARNEMELAYWTKKHHNMHRREYCKEYFRYFPPSDPVEEVEDRLRLYSLKPYLMYSAHARGHFTRDRALETMQYLITEYVPDNDSIQQGHDQRISEIGEYSDEILDTIEQVTQEEMREDGDSDLSKRPE